MGNREAVAQRLILQTNNRAFSLLEVSLVIFLLALFFSISLPIFSVANNSRLKDLSAKFVNIVDYTRDQAIITDTPHFLYLNSQVNKIFVYREESELNSFIAEKIEDSVEPFQRDKIFVSKANAKLKISNITYADEATALISIRFDPSGFSELFKISFTDGENFIHYEQDSVLGSFYVSTTK
jgi:hypothetical protein